MGRSSGVKLGLPLCLAVAAATAAVCYLGTLHHRFVFDDIDIIVRNPLVTDHDNGFARIFLSHYWAHLTPAGNLYRPLTIASYAINHRLGGLDPAGYHLVNILLHALTSSLVVAVAWRLGLSPGSALAAGLLFATHPIHTEAVTGVVGRAELLAAAFTLGAWLLHMSDMSPMSHTSPISDALAGRARLSAIGALFAAALLSKENAIVLPALMVLGDVWRARRGERARARLPAYLVCLGVALAWLAVRFALLSPIPAGSPYEGPFAGVPAGQRILTALGVMTRYAALLIRPVELSADYSFDQIPFVTGLLDARAMIGALLMIVLAAVAILSLAPPGSSRLSGLLAGFFLATIAPVSNLFVPIGTVMAERLLYLPSVAFCLALPALWSGMRRRQWRLTGPRWLGAGLVAVLAGTYALATIDRNDDWKDQLTLFSVTTITSPRSAKAHYNLGVALEDAGRPDDALAQYLMAVSIKPMDAKSHHNAGLLLVRSGRIAEASFHLDRASRLDPALPKVFSSLGAVYSRLGRDAEAATALHQALEHDPADHVALYDLGTLELSAGHPGAAVGWLARARELAPSDADTRYQLGLACLESGRPSEAIPELREALRLSPGLSEAHLLLARALLSTGEKAEALAEADRARAAGLALPRDLQEALGRNGAPP